MTVVLPSVSTAGSLRTIALRFAMRETPIASVIVTAAGSPSGMAPTASATAARNMSTALSPRSRPTMKVTAPSARMTMSSRVLKAAIFLVSGVESVSAFAMSSEMRPTSVSSPMPTTTPAPVPNVTSDEAYAMLRRSARTVSRASASVPFPTGSDSPVRADSSICRSRLRKRRRSAGTLSPPWSRTTSPGTSSVAETRVCSPLRRTVDSVVMVLASASMAWTALASCR